MRPRESHAPLEGRKGTFIIWRVLAGVMESAVAGLHPRVIPREKFGQKKAVYPKMLGRWEDLEGYEQGKS